MIRVPLVPRGKGGSVMLALNYLSFMLTASLIGPWRCRGKHDVIFVYEPSPVTVGVPARIIARLKKVPIFFWVQDLWPDSLLATGAKTTPMTIKLIDYLVRWIYKGCARILVQSEAFVEPIEKMGVSRDRILYFPNSAEAFYRPMPQRFSWDGPPLPKGFRVMFAGNIGAAQSFDTILSAAEKLH